MPLRMLISGRNSLIARHFLAYCAGRADIETVAVAHGDAVAVLEGQAFDVVVNCAFDPRLKSGPYEAAFDIDRRLATVAGRAHYVMLSTRKVYGPGNVWPAREDGPSPGFDVYGANKREIERGLIDALGDRLTVLRVANVTAFEFPEPGRRTFMSLVLRRLKEEGTILYDMDPAQKRDFIPMPAFCALMEAVVRARPPGLFNAGSGIGLPVGALAQWVMAGFGGGRLIVEDCGVSDEFVLDMTRTRAALPAVSPVGLTDLEAFLTSLGQELARI